METVQLGVSAAFPLVLLVAVAAVAVAIVVVGKRQNISLGKHISSNGFR